MKIEVTCEVQFDAEEPENVFNTLSRLVGHLDDINDINRYNDAHEVEVWFEVNEAD